METKTILEWLNTLPSPIKERAVRNYDPNCSRNHDRNNVTEALEWAFWWDKSPEGNDYWYKVFNGYYTEAEALLQDRAEGKETDHLTKANGSLFRAARAGTGDAGSIINDQDMEISSLKERIKELTSTISSGADGFARMAKQRDEAIERIKELEGALRDIRDNFVIERGEQDGSIWIYNLCKSLLNDK
jgi:hypothetical protein